MKKYYLSILAVACCLALPMTSLAATPLSAATSIGGTVAFAPSKSVSLNVTANDVAFCATALHAQGTEAYGLLSSDTKIYFSTITPAANQVAPTTSAADSLPTAPGSAWATK